MSSIDKRIVEMEFHSKGFKEGARSALETLKQLEEKLKMKNSTEGLKDVDKGIKNLTSSGLKGLTSGVNEASSKFSALGVIGVTALANVTNSVVNAGNRLRHALTLEPILTGFSEYETKMGSIQTILTNTAHNGTTLKEVTAALDELNVYADQTIYNFAEMTKNIGTFTAAGIDLKTSTAAIKGIANLAAASGSTSQQASTAMYQLSQALAAGKVSLADWNSVLTAGMGGKLFQDALIRTSEVLGTNAEGMIKKYGSFRESLTKGQWLTSEVLTETLKQLSGAYTEADLIAQGYTESQAKEIVKLAENATAAATEVKTVTQLIDTMKESVQSGWATSWEYIIGDKDQATKTLTAIKDGFDQMIKPAIEARNTMLKFWNENGGRDAVIKGLSNVMTSLMKGITAVKEGFRDIFPAMTGKRLVDISKKFQELTEKFKMSDKTANMIRMTFKGLFSVIDFGKNIMTTLLKSFAPVLAVLPNVGKAILVVTSSIGNLFSSINSAAEKSGIFESISNTISGAFKGIGKMIDDIANGVEGLFNALEALNFEPIMNFISELGSGLGKGIESLFGGIGKAIGKLNVNNLAALITSLAASRGLNLIKEIGEAFTGLFKSMSGFGKGITSTLSELKETLIAYQTDLQAGTLLKIASAIGILAVSVNMLSAIKPEQMETALSGLTVLFIEMILGLGALIKIIAGNKMAGLFSLASIGTTLLLFASSITILSVAVKSLSDLKPEELAKGIGGIASLIILLAGSIKLLSGSTKGLMKTSASLIVLSIALRGMAEAVKSFGKIDTNAMIKGLGSIAAILAELSLFLTFTNFNGMGTKSATGLLVLSGALYSLSLTVDKLGSMDISKLATGIGALSAVMLTLSAFTKLISGSKILTASIGLIGIATSLTIMSVAMGKFGQFKIEEIGRGLLAMAGSLSVMAAAAMLIPGGKLLTISVGIGGMSIALSMLSNSLKSMGGLSWEEIGKSLTAIAGSLTILGLAMAGMTGGLAGASAMLVMSAALALFIPQLTALSKLSLPQIGIGLLGLAGVFTVLGLAGLALAPVTPVLLTLAGVIVSIGFSCAAAGLGLGVFAAALATVAATGGAGVFVLVEGLKALIGLLPSLAENLAKAITSFLTELANGVPKMIDAGTKLIEGFLTAVSKSIPRIAEVAMELISTLCTTIAELLPQIVDLGITIILTLLEGLNNNIEKISSVAIDILVKFIDTISSNIGRVIQAGIDLAVNLVNGVANGIRNNAPAVRDAFLNLISACIEAIGGTVGKFLTKGRELAQNVAKGIKSKVGDALSAGKQIATNAMNGVKTGVSKMKTIGTQMIQGLIQGIKNMASKAVSAAKGVVENAVDGAKKLLGIHSPSRVFKEIGKFTVEGFAIGLSDNMKMSTDSAKDLAKDAITNMTTPLSRVSDMISGKIDATPVIRPVMDLSNVESGSRSINDMISSNEFGINATMTGSLSRSIGQIQNRTDNSDIISALKDLKDSMSNVGGTTNYINGITYDDGSAIQSTISELVRIAKIERRR